MLNQEVHKNLRRNKTGIHVDRIENLSPSYKRPPGFTLLPTLLTASMQNKSLDKNAKRNYNYVDASAQQKSPIVPSIVKRLAPKSPASVAAPKASHMIYSKPMSKNDILRWDTILFCFFIYGINLILQNDDFQFDYANQRIQIWNQNDLTNFVECKLNANFSIPKHIQIWNFIKTIGMFKFRTMMDLHWKCNAVV